MGWGRILELPLELQVHIFKNLSPSELIAFESLGSGNPFYKLSYEKGIVRSTDICRWTHATMKEVKEYLLKEKRWKNIRHLCLNDMIRLHSTNFMKQIAFTTKFRNLHSLHIVNCNVPLEQLQDVLVALPHLNELSWSLMVLKSLVKSHFSFGQVKKFYVESYLHGNRRHKQALLHVLKWFCNLEYLAIHFSLIVHTVANNVGYDSPKVKFQKLHSFVCTSETFHMFHSVPFYDDSPLGTHTRGIVETILEQRGSKRPWKRLWILNSSHGIQMYKLIEQESQVIGMRGATIENVEPQPLMEIGGPSVQFVQLDTCSIESEINQEEFLRNFFSLCCNITELNLFNTHLDPLAFPSRAISSLHRLKKLLIPVCGIFTKSYEISLSVSNHSSTGKNTRTSRIRPFSYEAKGPLADIVDGCPDLTDLDIRQFTGDTLCSTCRGTIKEGDIVPLIKLKNLRSLTLVGLQAARMPQEKLIETIAHMGRSREEFCSQLSMLRFYFVGHQSYHISMEVFKSAFLQLHCLRDVSLQHSTLRLEASNFWKVFSEVRTLERLCIVCNFTGQLPVKTIQNFIMRVPKLYVFHVHSRANNFKTTFSELRRFVEEINLTKNRHPVEIVIQHFTMHIGLTTTERMRHEGKIRHLQELCVPGTTIAQTRQKCGMKTIL